MGPTQHKVWEDKGGGGLELAEPYASYAPGPELALEMGEKEELRRKNDKLLFFRNLHGSGLYNCFTCMFLVSIDRKFAGDYEYAS